MRIGLKIGGIWIIVQCVGFLVGMLHTQPVFAAAPPPSGGYFTNLPPEAILPSEESCVGQVRRSPWEPRPENTLANNKTPAPFTLPGFTPNNGGVDIRARAYADRVTGNFKGTTDEIIQWGACKWGFSDEVARAVAVKESWWTQSALGDYVDDQSRCKTGYTAPCPESFGLMQVRDNYHPGTFPNALESTAFNVDYTLMSRRICYEGWVDWLHQFTDSYHAGDEWGCVGLWFSGRWYDSGASAYIADVQRILNEKPWRSWTDRGVPGLRAGDVDGNGAVNSYDLSMVLSNYGRTNQPRSQGDVSGDGRVDALDLSQVLSDYDS